MFYFILYFNNYLLIICKWDLIVNIIAVYIYIYMYISIYIHVRARAHTPSEVHPEGSSKKLKDTTETCTFTKLFLKSCVRLYYII
jgi:hypothetical protein